MWRLPGGDWSWWPPRILAAAGPLQPVNNTQGINMGSRQHHDTEVNRCRQCVNLSCVNNVRINKCRVQNQNKTFILDLISPIEIDMTDKLI